MAKIMKSIIEFNADPKVEMPEKLSLYLSGITYYAQEIMKETNAKTFEAKADMNRDGHSKQIARFTIEPKDE